MLAQHPLQPVSHRTGSLALPIGDSDLNSATRIPLSSSRGTQSTFGRGLSQGNRTKKAGNGKGGRLARLQLSYNGSESSRETAAEGTTTSGSVLLPRLTRDVCGAEGQHGSEATPAVTGIRQAFVPSF